MPALRFLAACGAVAMATAPVLAAAKDRADELFDLIAANDCRITGEQAEKLIAGAGFTVEESRRAIGQLLFDDRAGIEGNVVMAYGDPCPYAPSHGVTMLIQEMVATRRCSLHADDSAEAMAEWGLDVTAVRRVLPFMIEAGMIHLTDDENTLFLEKPGQCSDVAVPPSFHDEKGQAMTPRAQVIAFLEMHNCSVTYEQAKYLFPDSGMDWKAAEDAAQDMINAGEATISGSDERLTLRIGACS